jgi:hypothetical protein
MSHLVAAPRSSFLATYSTAPPVDLKKVLRDGQHPCKRICPVPYSLASCRLDKTLQPKDSLCLCLSNQKTAYV